jgi:hypothetical protein
MEHPMTFPLQASHPFSRGRSVGGALLFGLAGCATSEPPPVPAPAVQVAPAPLTPAPKVAEEPLVQNLPPEITELVFTPKSPKDGDSVHVDVTATDPEDRGMTFRYVWKVNDVESIEEHSATIRTSLKKGDTLSVTVVARDDEQDSEPMTLSATVTGLPPIMETTPNQLGRLDGVRMRASDPDGGDITWTLTGGPQGMAIDAAGVLHYKGSESEPGGSYEVAIVATDPDGDFAKMSVPITISPGSAAPKPDPAKAKAP